MDNNFNRLPELVVGVSRRLLVIVCDHFYGNTGTLGYVRRSREQQFFRDLNSLIGARLSDKKPRGIEERRKLLEIHHYLLSTDIDLLIVEPKGGRASALTKAASGYLEEEKLTAGAAGRLVVKAGCFFQTTSGRVGRGIWALSTAGSTRGDPLSFILI